MCNRYLSAACYLRAVEKSLTIGWIKFHSKSALDMYDKLALINPLHLKEIALPSYLSIDRVQAQLQGPRVFGDSRFLTKCRADLLWGYECELSAPLQKDHLFPYSLGGPTLPANQISLCEYHNQVKGSDIHCYPWEDAQQKISPWIDTIIEKLLQIIEQHH